MPAGPRGPPAGASAMNFHSWAFALFFPAVLAGYYVLPRRAQNRWLLAASYLFYGAWDWRFTGLLFVSTLTDYLCGLGMGKATSPRARKALLGASLAVNLGILFFFKYFLFLCENLAAALRALGIAATTPEWSILLPAGISFYTFQTLSYSIDVYRRRIEPERNFWDYALFVSFFPQLLAGPIERAASLLPQIREPRRVAPEGFQEGVFLVFWGLVKKLFIADNLRAWLLLYGDPSGPGGGAAVLLASYAFLFQLYCDFSAYSDIARGLAKCLGFELMENFRAPLFAKNIQDMWARWHISLTTWVRDYVYYPLALRRRGGRAPNETLLIGFTFVLIGLWHGAAWNFAVWGAYHGALLALYARAKPRLARFRRRLGPWSLRLYGAFCLVLTFHAAVYGALLFRAGSWERLVAWTASLVSGMAFHPAMIVPALQAALFVLPLPAVELWTRNGRGLEQLVRAPAWARGAFLYIGFYLIAVLGAKTPATFIYFQF